MSFKLSFIVFLVIFTQKMIYDFKYKTTRNETYNETTNESTIEKVYLTTQINVSFKEIIILFWVIALLFEELRQVSFEIVNKIIAAWSCET